MNLSQRVPLIAGIIGFVADVIGIGTFLVAMQPSQAASPVKDAVPIIILVIIGYSWLLLGWTISHIAIVREINRCKGKAFRPSHRDDYRLGSSIAVGVLASPLVLLTAKGIDSAQGIAWGVAGLLIAAIVIYILLSTLMPLVHDESDYE
ncbi:MAG TPA: hypothetical protein VF006_23040 [Longimicrobium sp.]